jgi:periplasmic divalent cation tolerance protein
MIIIYVTHENSEEAQKIVKHLLDKKLIACANTMPITSCYWWEGNQANAEEIVTLLKTRDEFWEQIKTEIESIHPYKIPCILKIDVEANDAFEKWIEEETQ